VHSNTPEHELPFLGGVTALIRWLEELVNITSGPVLTVGLGISLVDLLTDGALLSNLPVLLYCWAISQAVGVDAQLVASFDRARIALREKRWWSLAGLLLLGCALAYVAWVSAQVFATQQADGVGTSQALAMLGMSHTAWLVQRSILSVVLVCLSGWTRYHPPAKQRLSLEEELAEMDRQAKLAEAGNRLREVKALGMARIGRSLIAAARGSEDQQDDTTQQPEPTGPGSPVAAELPAQVEETEADTASITPLPQRAKRQTRQLPAAARASRADRLRNQAFRLLERDPDLSVNQLAKTLGCRWGKADQLKREFLRSQQSRRVAL
jgi:hypothetical protein